MTHFDRRKRRLHPNPVSLLSVQEIARRFNFHPDTVRRWVHEDGLRCYRGGRGPGGGKMWLREDEVLDFLARVYGPPDEEDFEDAK